MRNKYLSFIKSSPLYLGLFLGVLPIIWYFSILLKYSINIPYLDDFTFFYFIPNLFEEKEILEKVNSFFYQHNEHRILIDRIVALIIYILKGDIDYSLMMWVGNFMLLCIIFLLYKVFMNINLKILYFIPIPYLIFQTGLYENTFWGMASVQNFGVILFAFITIYLISSTNRKLFYLSFLFAFIVTYTSGNGMLANCSCLILLLLQKRFYDFLYFLIFQCILVLGYFYGYKSPKGINYFTEINLLEFIKGLFSFTGSFFDLLHNYPQRFLFTSSIGFLICVTVITYIIYYILKSNLFSGKVGLRKIDLFVMGCLLFILATSLTVVFARINFGQESLLASRYKIYSSLLLVLLYLATISQINEVLSSKLLIPFCLICLVMNIFNNYQSFTDVVNTRKRRICSLINPNINIYNKNLYEVPHTNITLQSKKLQLPIRLQPKFKEKYTISISNDHFSIQTISSKKISKKDDGVYIIAQSERQTYIFPTTEKRVSLISFIKKVQFENNEFNGDIYFHELQNDNYHLGLLIQDGNIGNIYNLNDSLNISHR